MRAKIQVEDWAEDGICLRPVGAVRAGECGFPDLEQVLWDWSLVLWAMHIPHRVHSDKASFGLCVARDKAQTAQEQIALFESENTDKITCPEPERAEEGSAESVFWVLMGVAIWHGVTHQQVHILGLDFIEWIELGRVDGRAILEHGQWWRVLTSLTLHSGPEHLLSNLVFGGLFLVLLSRMLGGGLAWLLTVISAGLANGLNVLVQGTGHLAIGGSTAVFAALGLVIGFQKPGRKRWSEAVAPVGAGLVLLAWLGTGGERTDVGAHVFGFLVGLAVGVSIVKAGQWNAGNPGQKPQFYCGLCALAVIVSAWGAAIF
ncbi:MAG: rhomboid family intramembrane serine protease [Desulfovermiculus sp.]